MLTIKDNRNTDKTMKRILFIIAAVAALAFTSCTKTVEDITSHYHIYAKSNTDHVTLGNDSNIVSEFYPKTTDAGVDTDITFSFRVDPSRASEFTEQGARLLPTTNYLFTKSVVSIPAMYRYDLSGQEICKLTVYHSDKLEPETVYFVPVVIEGLIGSGHAFFDKNEVFFITVKTTKAGTGNGTMENPYRVNNIEDLCGMKDLTVAGQTTYFRLEKDLDLSEVGNWSPLNTEDSNPFTIDFDGNGKTISNLKCTDVEGASFFGKVSGCIHDLTFEKAAIKAETAAINMAVVANSIGGIEEQSHVRNVVIRNSSITVADGCSSGNQAFVSVYSENTAFENVYVEKSNTMTLNPSDEGQAAGLVAVVNKISTFNRCGNAADIIGEKHKGVAGIVGKMYKGDITESWNTGAITGNEDVAGIAGSFGDVKEGLDTRTHTIMNCYNRGKISAIGQRIGGIVGTLYNSTDLMYCYNVGDVVAKVKLSSGKTDGRCIGGIVGHACNGAGGWNYNSPNGGGVNRLISCHVFSQLIMSDTSGTTSARPGSGVIIGFAHLYNTYKGCYRAPWYGNNDPSATGLDISRTQYPEAIPVDQEDSTPESPLQAFDKGKTTAAGTISGIGDTNYSSPYHGKITDKTTVSALVQSLGGDIAWDSAIWDFSGDTPTLKNNHER